MASLVYLALLGSVGILAAYLAMRRGMRIVAREECQGLSGQSTTPEPE